MTDQRFATIRVVPPYNPGDPIPVPTGVPQSAVDLANAESRRRIVQAYDTGMRVVAEQLQTLLATGWQPDRESVEAFCRLVEKQSPRARR